MINLKIIKIIVKFFVLWLCLFRLWRSDRAHVGCKDVTNRQSPPHQTNNKQKALRGCRRCLQGQSQSQTLA